ncbi:MAG: hypothetical protein F9K30_05005 [Dechloromonas sp.]|nr:MAG: hypothetical protein F9K30_05005 [Dechloromonas sp.]
MQFPITIGLHRSSFLERLLIVIAALSIGAIVAFPMQSAYQGLLVLSVTCLLLWYWRRLSPTLSAIRLERDGRILAFETTGSSFSESVLLPRAIVHPWLTVFRLELVSGRRHTLALAKGSLGGEDFRRLRMFLRWRARFSASDAGRGEPCS